MQVYRVELAKEVMVAAGKSEEESEEPADEEALPAPKSSKRAAAEMEAEEMAKMKDIMMPRKTRKLYERINRAVEGKRERVETLERKKQSLQHKAKK